jgi:hypothetical protein
LGVAELGAAPGVLLGVFFLGVIFVDLAADFGVAAFGVAAFGVAAFGVAALGMPVVALRGVVENTLAAADGVPGVNRRCATLVAADVAPLPGVRDLERCKPGESGEGAKGFFFFPVVVVVAVAGAAAGVLPAFSFFADAAVGRMNPGVAVGVLRAGVADDPRTRVGGAGVGSPDPEAEAASAPGDTESSIAVIRAGSMTGKTRPACVAVWPAR